MDFSGCRNDDTFGPTVRGCRGDFDFTIKFEQLFLAIIPPSVFVAVALPRLVYLWRQPAIVSGALLRTAKLICIAALAGLQLGLLVLSASQPGQFQTLLTAASALALVGSLCMLVLSWLEHARALRPSLLLAGYLFLDVLFDATQARTFWLARSASRPAAAGDPGGVVVAGYRMDSAETVFCRLFTAAVGFKALLLVLESVQKRAFVRASETGDTKNRSPEEASGLFGLGAFFWLQSLFRSGFRKVLVLDDLFSLDPDLATDRLQARLARYERTNDDGRNKGNHNFGRRKHGLFKALAKALAVPLLLPVGPRIALVGFQFCQPFLINAALEYLQEPAAEAPRSNGYGLIGATFLIYLGTAVSAGFYWYFQERALFMVRGALAGAVYRKTTEAALNTADDAAAITLMSTDVERIRVGLLLLHEYWANLVQVALASWLLEREIGAAFVAPLAVIVVCVLCLGLLAWLTNARQKAWMATIQKRVGMTSTAVANMKHLKIAGLAAPVETLIQQLRVEELRTGGRFRLIVCLAAAAAFAPNLLSPVFTFAATARDLTVANTFTTLSLVMLVAMPFIGVLQSVPGLIGALACLDRIQAFLERGPRVDFRAPLHAPHEKRPLPGAEADANQQPTEGDRTISVSGGSYGWAADKFNLRGIDLDIASAQLTIVVGPVASGKSTLCKALLGETPAFEGRLRVDLQAADGRPRRIGYCDQTPYLANASIRDNIVGFTEASGVSLVDEARYSEAVRATMLLPDLALLPRGDRTKVGSNGITLSGGQKQRVSIARALYADADLYIFDDVLSGLDTDTEEHVFQNVFGPEGLLRARRHATVVLCTHSVRRLPSADHVVALAADGTILEQGSYQSLLANRNYVHSLGVKMVAVHDGASGGSSEQSEARGDLGVRPVEADATKRVASVSTIPALRTNEERDENVEEEGEGDGDEDGGLTGGAQDKSRQLGDTAVYKHYFKMMGVLPLVLFSVFGLSLGFLFNWGSIWLKFWAEDKAQAQAQRRHTDAFYLGLYALFQSYGLLSLFLYCLVCLLTMVKVSGARLHRTALRTVIRAPLRFFTQTDNGVVTNYFSQDMTLVDGELPNALISFSSGVFVVLCSAAVIATASPYLAITYPFLAAVLYGVQKFYLRTSRQLRLLDLEAKSPLYTHFLDTLRGLATFRAFGWVPAGVARNDRLVDRSQQPAYLLAMVQRWLNFALQVLVALLATVVVTLATQLRSNTAFTGASLILLMNFGDFVAYIMFAYTQLETSIGAISRLKAFSETVRAESDADGAATVVPPPAWPTRGAIQLVNVSASYADVVAAKTTSGDEKPQRVLDHISLSIQPGEKVAICGRTGSGKSSLILLLLRLLDPLPLAEPPTQPNNDENKTTMLLDGLPLDTIDRVTLRERVIAVPQDAVFFPDGTSFQKNLDPFDGGDAALCRSVLELVELWPFVAQRGGLTAGLFADTLSQGQKQLFNLARAILRRRVRERTRGLGRGSDSNGGGILLLDEVSSSVDQDTDRAMQKVIRDEFAAYTVVMVSHRLDMVLATCDTVVVLDQGRVVETGAPRVLAAAEGTRFRALWLLGNQGAGGERV
ncbi:ABC transporter, transmembrane domain, type 1 [Niveomyces insectorum RCEF 264]|uniref:ABC transporter, transmembrane domain, type 1 n=1 Tax=Niveomyces insectorum RCEF 264 TaxID=1081102 RepID=A0A167M1S7_9HYPO|nr:ABC transporter, transmembrane domain, type 1 [Niveomyces insectorum RCEF 264]